MIARPMVARNRARYLAPIALAVVIAGTYVVVHSTLTAKSPPAPTVTTSPVSHAQKKFVRSKFYVVRSGDSLTSIATRTGVSLPRLEELNPGLDPNALQTGQRLRLRR
jgi:LysM repeat protein